MLDQPAAAHPALAVERAGDGDGVKAGDPMSRIDRAAASRHRAP